MLFLKKFTVVGALVLSPVLGHASDFSGPGFYDAELTVIKGKKKYQSGKIRYNTLDQSLTLSLQPKMKPCPEGMMCTAVMPKEKTIKLKKATINVDSCNITTIKAKKGSTSNGGTKQIINVIDYRSSFCQTVVDADIQVTYKKRGSNKETVRLQADEFIFHILLD